MVMKVVTSLTNQRTRQRKTLGKLPMPIPSMQFKRTDKLYLKCKIKNDTPQPVDTRIEFWLGNRLIDSIGRDSVDHVTQVQEFIKPGKVLVLAKVFTVAERDINATITVGTLFNYTKTDHRNISLKVIDNE